MIGTGVLDYVRMMLNGRRDCRICFGTPYPLDDGPFPAETRTRGTNRKEPCHDSPDRRIYICIDSVMMDLRVSGFDWDLRKPGEVPKTRTFD